MASNDEIKFYGDENLPDLRNLQNASGRDKGAADLAELNACLVKYISKLPATSALFRYP